MSADIARVPQREFQAVRAYRAAGADGDGLDRLVPGHSIDGPPDVIVVGGRVVSMHPGAMPDAQGVAVKGNKIRIGIDALIAETKADELMIVSDIYDHAARLHSFDLIAASSPVRG